MFDGLEDFKINEGFPFPLSFLIWVKFFGITRMHRLFFFDAFLVGLKVFFPPEFAAIVIFFNFRTGVFKSLTGHFSKRIRAVFKLVIGHFSIKTLRTAELQVTSLLETLGTAVRNPNLQSLT